MTLPKKWVKQNKLKSGANLGIIAKRDCLLLLPEKKKKSQIELKHSKNLEKEIKKAYLQAHKKIIVKNASYEELFQIKKDFPGLEIQFEDKHLVLIDILDYKQLNLKQLLKSNNKRLHLLAERIINEQLRMLPKSFLELIEMKNNLKISGG